MGLFVFLATGLVFVLLDFGLNCPAGSVEAAPEFEPDWGDDDDEPPLAPPEPVDFAKVAENAGAENRDEVMDRVLQLLEQQLLQRQAMVERQEVERTRANWQEDAFRLLCGPEPLKLLDLLPEVSASNILTMVDGNGLNLLHQSCRIGCVPVVEGLLALNPALADQLTNTGGRPAHWSVMMVLLDAKNAMTEEDYMTLVHLIIINSSLATLEARAANGSSALHMAASRGQFWSLKKLLYGIYNKAKGDQAAFGLVSSLLNQPNGRGAGCVSCPQ